MRICKRKLKIIFAINLILLIIIFSGTVFAEEFKLNTTEAYEEWQNLSEDEKTNSIMPRTFDIDVPNSILNEHKRNLPNMIYQLLSKIKINNFKNVLAVNEPRYNLADKLNIRVENQGSTSECWAFSVLKSFETNIALSNGVTEIPDFSERHMDYATSRTFLNGINEKGINREVGQGGLLIAGLSYLSNGQGAVLEDEMPFEDNEQKINLEDINKPVDRVVGDYVYLPTIHKTYEKNSDGSTLSVKYLKPDGSEYSESELRATRNIIKEHIVKYGAIATMTGGTFSEFYSNKSSIFESESYNCNDTSKIRDHAITIVGWDDNYSRNNFPEEIRPSSDGAYIVLNTYGENSFKNGYIYISYEDYFVEQEIYGINSTSYVDYDNIYQHDFFGGIYEIGIPSTNEGYYGVTYNRNSDNSEILKSVGVTLADYANIDIYVNPYDNTFDNDKLIKVATTEEYLEPGYHKINITPVQLNSSNFSIVVKQVSENKDFFFEIEANVPDTVYNLVSSDNKSFVSTDGNVWTNISNLDVRGVDMKKADVCIKAFTTNVDSEETDKEITSNEYKIDDNYIMNIPQETTISTLLDNLNTEFTKTVLTSENIEVSQNTEIVKTGMKLQLSNGSIYTLIVKGDITKDGRVSLLDLSKLILQYNEVSGYELHDDELKAADLNIDGRISIIDISQMVIIYNSVT